MTEFSDLPGWQQCSRTLAALQVTLSHTSGVMMSVRASSDSTSDQVAAELRDSLDLMATELQNLLATYVQPIWDELPEDIQELCRQGGF